ncbi:arsenical resistance operon trans-acting repressor ArsD [Anaerotignum neopropionicum]|uniref:Arsenical resistance operon trans-acting repressor ArsD n=1 Tax=Anaerotignum neopropionicum TaxID=36847 RepID=A0A136WCN3_9FIRM|nr:arsenite efflux transporter metallochaperone ArsD [Anaerotignum neopropionicum]KXL52264.1 arsenical resistance operon trans-acting repressor ArsD [Anaerotignum neopropionicum]
MKNMQIFETAMCCSTGLCGVGVDPELLRISTVLNSLEKNGVKVDRFNLSSSPQEFITNKVINDFIKEKGVDELPVTILDDEIVITGRYPSNDEFVQLIHVPKSYIGEKPSTVKDTDKKTNGCGCSGGKGCC